MPVSLIVRVEDRADGYAIRVIRGSDEDATPIISPRDLVNKDHTLFLRSASLPAAGVQDKRVKRRVKRQEQKFAIDVQGRTQPGSGSQGHAKGDVRAPLRLRGECKSTSKASYTVAREVLNKIRKEARYPEIAAVDISFVNDKDNKVEDRWLMLPYEQAMALMEKAWNADDAASDNS